LTGLAAAFGQIVEVRVNRKVHCDVMLTTVGGIHIAEGTKATSGNVLQNDVIKLVLENVLSRLVTEGSEEGGIVSHFQLAFFGHSDTSGGNAPCSLVNPSRESREKRLVNQQTVNVQAKIKRLDLSRRFQLVQKVRDFVSHIGSSARGLVSHVISYSLSIPHLGVKCKRLYFILKQKLAALSG
jgi:hypothetical protein